MFLASSIALFAAILVLVFWVRPTAIELGPPPDPRAHLEERKSAIYSNLRDLTFEYRLGKLSDADYEKSKHGLQEELAKVMAELDASPGTAAPAPAAKPAAAKAAKAQSAQAKPGPAKAVEAAIDPLVCPYCKACFDKPMKFCGECGKPMPEVKA
jgi:hypothetical protein